MTSINRRYFLGASAAMAANFTLARAEDKKVGANEKVNVALVGCGGMGRANLRDFAKVPEFNITALCDVDSNRFKDAVADLKSANRPTELFTTQDFRKIVEKKDIDAVIVATPDHWHAYVLIAACANDKDVYCEKPLSHNVVEGRAMVKAAQGKKRVVQIGTQQRSGKHFQDAVQFVRSGKLGHVHTTRTWITNGTDAKGNGTPADEDKAPDGVDYNLWLGPAPLRKFNKNRFHYNFRWFWDYGNGLCNDWGVHLNDIILWGMNVKAPISVSAIGGRYDIQDNSDTPDSLDIYYEFPGFTHVYTVRRGQSLVGFHGKKHGMEFSGSNGTLTVDRGGWITTPEGDKLQAEKHPTSEQHLAHVQNFLHCIHHRGEKTASDIEDMHRATTLCHLANISYKVRRRLYWDAEHERCYRGYDPATKQFKLEDAEANAYLLREPRKPWSLTV